MDPSPKQTSSSMTTGSGIEFNFFDSLRDVLSAQAMSTCVHYLAIGRDETSLANGHAIETINAGAVNSRSLPNG
jgi:hypothetical protein